MARGQNEYRSYSSTDPRKGASSSRGRSTDPFTNNSYQSAYTPNSQIPPVSNAYATQNGNGQYSRNSSQYSSKRNKSGIGKKVAIVVVALVVLIGAGAGVAYGLYVDKMNRINDQLQGDKTEEEVQVIKESLVPEKTFDEPFYVMLVGSDARDDDEEMGERSDTNILARVDAANAKITLVSIPRDTMIEIDGYGTQKFNAAYTYGGIAGTIKEASQLCGVDISHYAEIDFNALIQLVDVIGGVEVMVDERIDDPDAGPNVIEAGLQTLNGDQALTFARSRYYADGDFTRTANQRKLIEAIVMKMLNTPAVDLTDTVEQASSCVTTDMSAEDIVALARQFRNREDQEVKDITIYSAMVPSTTAMVGEVSYVITDTVALKEMMKLVEAGQDPSTVTNSENVALPNGAISDDATGQYNNGYSEGYNDGSYNDGSYDNGYSDNSYYEDNSYNYSEPQYEEPAATGGGSEAPPADTGGGDASGGGDTGGGDGGNGGGAGGGDASVDTASEAPANEAA